MAVPGKRVIHPRGRRATEELPARGEFRPAHRVLDVGCGVGTRAIAIARRCGSRATAVAISAPMLDRARTTVMVAGAGDEVMVEEGDILAPCFPDGPFDCVLVEAVTLFVDRTLADREQVDEAAGLTEVPVTSGPFAMMTPRGVTQDEGLANSLASMRTGCRALTRRARLRMLAWRMPRMRRAAPHPGDLAMSGVKPA